MNSLINLLLRAFPLLILGYGIYGSYQVWLDYEEQLETIDNEIKVVKDNTEKLRKKNNEISTFKETLEVSRLRIDEINKQMDELKKQLPNSINDTEVMDLLSTEATKMNIRKLSLEPLREIQEDFYFSKQYRIGGQGTWLQYLVFFEQLGNQERIYNVKRMEIKKSDDQKGRFQILSFDTVMEAFRYNPERDLAIQEKEKAMAKASANKKNSRKAGNKKMAKDKEDE